MIEKDAGFKSQNSHRLLFPVMFTCKNKKIQGWLHCGLPKQGKRLIFSDLRQQLLRVSKEL